MFTYCLSSLVFSGLFGSVVWCLSLKNLENSPSFLIQITLLLLSFLYFLYSHFAYFISSGIVSQILNILFIFCILCSYTPYFSDSLPAFFISYIKECVKISHIIVEIYISPFGSVAYCYMCFETIRVYAYRNVSIEFTLLLL